MAAISKIGRFKVIREISQGGQGTVYLAEDTQLERRVAIKMLHSTSAKQKEDLLREARITSKLQHRNIVTLFDAGEHAGVPYLVYAYIEGETLAQLLKRSGALSVAQAARLVAGVLDGLSYAHQQGVMHLDIKPANVIVDQQHQPMLLDFGIARHISKRNTDGTVEGTPQYMAPENLDAQGVDLRSDIYSTGIMLYETVTGKPAVFGNTLSQILNRVANDDVKSPSAHNVKVDERLEAIILKAAAKKPDQRYPDATAMRQALLTYLDSTQEAMPHGSGDSHSALEFLMRRMRSKSDFPALSGIISEINQIVSSESESHRKLAQAILQDFALTNKIIKLVNTATFGQFGGKINTISKAVVILGFDTVRNVAMSLILLEFLQNKAQAVELKDEAIAAFFAGILAEELAAGNGIGAAEEAMICAMFHNLGRLLATFYFFEESREISRLMEDQQISEAQASIRVLGMSYDDLGAGVAENWNFPSRLVNGMRKLPDEKIGKPQNDIEQLKITVNLANELCQISAITDVKQKTSELSRLCKRYSTAMEVSGKKLSAALETGLDVIAKRSAILGISASKSPVLKKIRTWSGHTESEVIDQTVKIKKTAEATAADFVSTEPAAATPSAPPSDSDAMLNAGIQDVTNTLVEDYNLNDVLYMVLETIYRSLGFRHSLIFIRDNKQQVMLAKFGFGEHVDNILPKLRFPLSFTPDVFHLAIEKGLDIVIDNIAAPTIADKIPKWYLESIDAKCFLLLPIMVNKKALGLLYADMQQADSLKLSEKQLAMLRTLRNQAVLAIKTKLL